MGFAVQLPKSVAIVPTPRVRLQTERLFVDAGGRCEEVEAAAIVLEFDYDGRRIAALDPRREGRCPEAEARARRLLEGLGAVDLECLGDCAAAPDSRASHVVHLGADVHELLAFSAYALPQLRDQGFEVEVAPDYPYQAVEPDAPFVAEVESGKNADWFALHLGVDVDGQRLDLLPALLDLLDQTRDLGALRRSLRRCIAVPVGERRYLPVPPERLRLLLEVLLELYGHGEPGAEVPLARAGALARLGLAFADAPDILRWRGDTSLRDLGKSMELGRSRAEPAKVPDGLRAELRPYQREGLAWLQHLRACAAGGVLADDMGLGKTLQVIAHLLLEKRAGRLTAPSLVIAPTSLIGNWSRELRKFAPSLSVLLLHGARRKSRFASIDSYDVVLTSYPLLVRDREKLGGREYHVLVLDEAHQIKNRSSLTHQAARSIQARQRLCVTGTPIENHLGELWSLFDFLQPGLLGSAEQFGARFRAPIEQLGDEERLRVLRDAVKPYILRRTKEQVAADLPPKTEIVRAVELGGAQRELYESIRLAAHARVRTAIRTRGLGQSTITVLDALLKLRQVCCDPRLASVDAAREVQESAKLDLLAELVTRQIDQGRKILIFSQFTTMLALIGERMHALGIDFVDLTGATANRQRQIDAFQRGDVDLFLISLKAGGCGLNLTRADVVIHYDPWWNPAAQAQASDRAHRIGQTRPVLVYNLIVAGSVEERMMRLQRHKRRLADAILAPRTAPMLSERDVDDLLAPLGHRGSSLK